VAFNSRDRSRRERPEAALAQNPAAHPPCGAAAHGESLLAVAWLTEAATLAHLDTRAMAEGL